MGCAVYTVGEICKKCYSCVRACPTKAIEVHSGQADIREELCISCGYCVNMCSQNAKRVKSAVDVVDGMLKTGPAGHRVAMLAPSFPAAFLDVEPGQVVGALKKAGFDGVYEVAFGADLVSYEYYRQYRQLLEAGSDQFIISSPCPAIVNFVEKVHPELVPYLAHILSPMEAMAKVVRERIDADAQIVFIGPCVAKKDEAERDDLVNEVMTFDELVELFDRESISMGDCEKVAFDPPVANLGRIYPVTGGLLKAAAIDADMLVSPVYVVEGAERVSDILSVLGSRVEKGEQVVNRLFDLLFCEGCIAGPVIPNNLTFYERRKYIIRYMQDRPLISDIDEWAEQHADYLSLDMSKTFHPVKTVLPNPTEEEIRAILAKTNKYSEEDELNCRACGYNSCREKAIAVYRGTAEVEMCLPYLISQLETVISDLKSNQIKLIQAEKLASMGQMAAGIAHEINNPLGVVLMYSHLLKEEMDAKAASNEDVNVIIREAERTRKIVQGILNFARKEKIDRNETDINALVTDAVNGVRSMDPESKITVNLELDPDMGRHSVDESQLRQVFDNILKNAVEVMADGGTLTVITSEGAGEFVVKIADTGPGIPPENLSQVFSPFFTTKPVGKGTGLGLPVCYGIVKMHGGSIQAGNNAAGGAYFEIKIKHWSNKEDSVVANTHSG